MTSGNIGNDARIEQLEVRVAHQDQTLHELSEEVYRQQRQIQALEAIVKHLSARVAAAEAGQPGDQPSDEVPPHY